MTAICDRYESLRICRQDIADVFRYHSARLKKVSDIAAVLDGEIENLSGFIQQHTAVVCPQCSSVCCINRHSYHTFEDVVYIYALGEQVPLHAPGLDDSVSCQFLGKLGCVMPRSLRPYRCNWYFCSPLLARLTELSTARQYRLFITLLQKITRARQRLMEEYNSEVKRIGLQCWNKT